jgi:hypothetical protein
VGCAAARIAVVRIPAPAARRFLSILAAVSLLQKTTTSAATANIGDARRVPIVGLLPWRLDLANYFIAVAPESNTPALSAEVDSLMAFISTNYPSANFTSIGARVQSWGVILPLFTDGLVMQVSAPPAPSPTASTCRL